MDLLSNNIEQSSIEARGGRRRIQKRRRNKRIPQVIFNFILISIIVGSSTLGYAAWRFEKALDHIFWESNDPTEKTPSSSELSKQAMDQPEETKAISVLIMGRDSRPETGTNLTDVMMVAAIDPAEKEVSMVSIPRDTKVMVPEVGRKLKLNSVYNAGDQLRREADRTGHVPDTDGPGLAKKTVSRLFNIPIDHYIVVDFNSFVEIVDEVGGITVQVERDLVYDKLRERPLIQ